MRVVSAVVCLIAACGGSAADTVPAEPRLVITSPSPMQDLSGAEEVRIAWQTTLGEDIEFCVVYSSDGSVFDRPIAYKLAATECDRKPERKTDLIGWIKVKAFRMGYLMAEATVRVSFIPPAALVVSKADQKLYHFSQGKLANVFTCSTGLPGYDPEPGRYTVYLRSKNHYSSAYEVPMPYALFFHKGYAVHATTVIRRLGRPASHGCIRLHPKDARALYDQVRIGTPVIVLAKSKSCAFLADIYRPAERAAEQTAAAG